MLVKEIAVCMLLFAQATYAVGGKDISERDPSSEPIIGEKSTINKNNWNTRKWGSIYFLLLNVNPFNLTKSYNRYFLFVKIGNCFGRFISFFFSGIVEYKYMFHRQLGINVRLNLNNVDNLIVPPTTDKIAIAAYLLSFDCSLEWIYARKGKKIFSGSFSLLGVGWITALEGNNFKARHYLLSYGFILLKYEYDRRFYLNFGKVKGFWQRIKKYRLCKDLLFSIFSSYLDLVFSLEIGLNIVGVNDWRKNRKKKGKNGEV